MSELKFDPNKSIELLRRIKLFDVDYYLERNPDVRQSGIDPVYHYVVAGEGEGRCPTPLFDPLWYAGKYKVDASAVNLFLHYLAVGEKAGFNPSPFLDVGYVRQQQGRDAKASVLKFFLDNARNQSVDPTRYFVTAEYLALNEDVKGSILSPYLHFILFGANEDRQPSKKFSYPYVRSAYGIRGDNLTVYRTFCEFSHSLGWTEEGLLNSERLQAEFKRNQIPSNAYEATTVSGDRTTRSTVDVFAFYLPQFHKVEENDSWWGDGFTEWVNLARGMPRYEGHYQPRVPGALGYYDLSVKEALSAQCKLAARAGLSGFGIYYYDFGAKSLLRRPLEILRSNRDLETKYFLIWANETWSRRWDGSDADILIEQTYPKGFERRMAKDFSVYFSDERYHKIDGRPLLVIYRAKHLPNSVKFIRTLRAEFKKMGYEPLIYTAQSFGDLDPRDHGADGALEFPPHKLSANLAAINSKKNLYSSNPELRIYAYDDVVNLSLSEAEPEYPLIKTAFPSWDNDARKQGASTVFDGASPQKFEGWLRTLIEREQRVAPERGVVCINAWNEWGEGAYLEPDRHLGYANLNAVSRALHNRPSYRKESVVLVGHDLFDAGAQRLLLEIGKRLLQQGADVLFLVASGAAASGRLHECYRKVGEVRFLDEVAKSNSWDQLHAELQLKGARRYIFNTALSAQHAHCLPRFSDCRYVLLVHEMAGMLALSCDAERLRQNVNLFSSIVFPARIVREQFEKFFGGTVDNSVIHPQGMYKNERDLRAHDGNRQRFMSFVGRKRRPLVVAGIGYADLRKGFDLFVNTCVELTRREVDVLFVWQGGIHPEFDRWLSADMGRLIQQKRLLLVPTNENIGNVLEVADAYFLSSREDPFPSVAMEAWSFGVPVVAFKGAGGISDLMLKQPRLGCLSEPLSIVDAADQLQTLADSRQGGGLPGDFREFRKRYVAETHNFERYVDELGRFCGLSSDVDVCVLTYNHERFVGERLESLLEQTAFRRSLVVYDAGSSDSTKLEVERFNAERERCIRLVELPRNGGYLPKLWTEVVRLSSAEYIWLAEGDDSARPDFLDRCVRMLRGDPSVGLVFTDVQRIDEKGESMQTSLQGYFESIMGKEWAAGGVFEGSEFLSAGATVANPITNISGVVWRRRALLEALKIFEQTNGIKFAFDWLLYVALAKSGWRMAYVPEALNRHRIYGRSFSGGLTLKEHKSEITSIHRMIDRLTHVDNKAMRVKYLETVSK